ncbi:MAG TPA: hypothetical protein VF914_11245 [Chloroflexia bacterium]|jgi:hypothetical protein
MSASHPPDPNTRLQQSLAFVEALAGSDDNLKNEIVSRLLDLAITLHLGLDADAEINLERGSVRIVEAIRAAFKDAAANVYDVVVAGKGEVSIRFDVHWPREKHTSSVERISPENSLKLHKS